jgi:AbiU2
MNKKDQLRIQVAQIAEIFLTAKENFNYCYYLHNPSTPEESEYLKVDRNLNFIRHSLWRMSVIELVKLYSSKENDKFNLQKILNRLSPGGDYAELGIDYFDIVRWESRLLGKEIAISNIVTLRDKIYAHTDPNKNDYKQLEVYFYDIEELLEIAATIIKDIYLKVFQTTINLKTPTFDRTDFDLVKVLAKAHRDSVQAILDLKKHGS